MTAFYSEISGGWWRHMVCSGLMRSIVDNYTICIKINGWNYKSLKVIANGEMDGLVDVESLPLSIDVSWNIGPLHPLCKVAQQWPIQVHAALHRESEIIHFYPREYVWKESLAGRYSTHSNLLLIQLNASNTHYIFEIWKALSDAFPEPKTIL